jgi:hypothetical protein
VAPESPVFGGQSSLDERLGDFAIFDRAMESAVAKAHHAQRLAGPIKEFQFGGQFCEKRGRQGHERQGEPGCQQNQDVYEDSACEPAQGAEGGAAWCGEVTA